VTSAAGPSASIGQRPVMSEASKQLVRRLIEEVWAGCSATAARELTARKYTEHAVAPLGGHAPGPVDGPQHVLGVGRWLREQFPDLHITIEALIAEGDTIAVRTSSEGTNLGKFSGVLPATGKRFVSCQSHWFRVADGKLVEHWAVRDDLSTVLQLGIVRRPGDLAVDESWPPLVATD
jgi:predicted SnoaL-like aldol condensation-catalyzing enzyme